MQNKMRKQIECKGKKITIEVSLSAVIERRPYLTSFHKVEIWEEGGDYKKTIEINTRHNLEDKLMKIEQGIKEESTLLKLSKEEQILVDLGYSKSTNELKNDSIIMREITK
ncbi:hypothetical protein TMP248_60136 [Tenacibaculum maritimum]|nr:hypothetical protein TMP248_60136 [Tenacibaculum maritimum]